MSFRCIYLRKYRRILFHRDELTAAPAEYSSYNSAGDFSRIPASVAPAGMTWLAWTVRLWLIRVWCWLVRILIRPRVRSIVHGGLRALVWNGGQRQRRVWQLVYI